MNWQPLLDQLDNGLRLILAAGVAYIVTLINRQTKAVERRETREASFDAAAQVELEARKRPITANEKLDRAVQLANDATPSNIKVEPKDIEAVLPRVRASLPTESVLDSLAPGEPIPVTVVSSIPAADVRITSPLPPDAPVPREWTAKGGING